MRVLIFYDAPHQVPIVEMMEQALAANAGAEVLRAGPVAGGAHFSIAGDRTWRKSRGLARLIHRIERKFLSIERRLSVRKRRAQGWAGRRSRAKHRTAYRTAKSGLILFRSLIIGAPAKFIRWLLHDRVLTITSTLLASAEAAARQEKDRYGTRLGRLPRAYARGLADVRRRFGFRGLVTLAGIAPLAAVTCLLGVDIAAAAFRRRSWLLDARAMVRRARPDLVLLMEDNVEGLTGAVSWAARREGAPLIVVPDYIPNPAEPAAYYSESSAHGTFGPRACLVARLLPKWTHRCGNRPMLRLPVSAIVAYHLLRCDPPKPWILNSGYAAAITLESEAMRRHYRALGFRDEKLAVIGSPRDDMLRCAVDGARDRRADLMSQLGLDPSQLLVVCGFPPDQYDSPGRTRFEFADFEAMAEAWFAGLSAAAGSAGILVKPHPRLPRNRLDRFEGGSIRIVDWEATETLLAMADLYVASASTTIRWALALGLPTLNYDSYRYRYGDFAMARGVVEVDTAGGFARILVQLVTDQEAYDDLKTKAVADRENWGLLDRKFGERLSVLASNVAARRDVRTSTHFDSEAPA